MVQETELYRLPVEIIDGDQVLARAESSHLTLTRSADGEKVEWKGELRLSGDEASRYPTAEQFDIRCSDGRVGSVRVTSRGFDTSPTGAPSKVTLTVTGQGEPPFGRHDATIAGVPATATFGAMRASGSATVTHRSESSATVSRTDSAGIRLHAMKIVERVAREVEDAADDAATKQIASAVLGSLPVLAQWVRDGRDTIENQSAFERLYERFAAELEQSKVASAIRLASALKNFVVDIRNSRASSA